LVLFANTLGVTVVELITQQAPLGWRRSHEALRKA